MAKRPLNRPLGNSELVYSSDSGVDVRRGKGKGKKKVEQQQVAKSDGVVRLRRETKGRGGKTVTTVSGVPVSGSELKELGGDLKRLCGTGGAIKDGMIEIQGDHRDKLGVELEKRGFVVKFAGG